MYGDFRAPVEFGTGGEYGGSTNGSRGGGAIKIVAGSLELSGTITANGQHLIIGSNAGGGGSGGSVWLDVGTLSNPQGTGLITANGGRGWFSGGGGGGRIAIYYDSLNGFDLSADVQAVGGTRYSGATGTHGGAGTIYSHSTVDTFGSLIVDNGDLATELNSTPILNVGVHQIVGLIEIEAGLWEVEVVDSLWQASDQAPYRGVAGIIVDLDASELAGPTYLIESNTENRITIRTDDDLSQTVLLGDDLLGEHVFETIRITGNGSVTFGEDRVIVLDLINSIIEEGSSLEAGASSLLP